MSTLTPRLDRLDKNYLINGDFEFWQRNATFSTTGYTADRWRTVISGTGTITRNTSVIPDGSLYTARWTSGGGSSFSLAQALESNWTRALKGQTVTVAIKIKRNATYDANFQFALQTNSTADTATGGTWVSLVSTTLVNANIPTANYLTVSLTATIPNDTSANGIRVIMSHSGSSIVGSILDMSQVTLTIGDKVPNSFCRAATSYEEEFRLCQRYYEKSYDLDVVPATITDEGRLQVWTMAAGANKATFEYKASKRVSPTLVIYNNVTGTSNQIRISGGGSAVPSVVSYRKHFNLGFTGATANSDAEWHFAADAELT